MRDRLCPLSVPGFRPKDDIAHKYCLARWQQVWPDLTSVCRWQCDRFRRRGSARRIRRPLETEARRKRSECPEWAESRSRDTPGIPAGWAVSDKGSRAQRSQAGISTKPSCYSTRRALHTKNPGSSKDSYERPLRFPQNIRVDGGLPSIAERSSVETRRNISRLPGQRGT